MKQKSIATALALIAMLSSHASAYEIYKGKVTKHKEWASKNTKGRFIPYHSKKNTANKKNQPGSIYLYLGLLPSKGSAGSDITVSGYGQIQIMNFSNESKSYSHRTMTCSNGDNNLEHCIYAFTKFTLEPNGTFIYFYTPELIMNISKPGSYLTKSYTSIYSSDENELMAETVSNSTLEIA